MSHYCVKCYVYVTRLPHYTTSSFLSLSSFFFFFPLPFSLSFFSLHPHFSHCSSLSASFPFSLSLSLSLTLSSSFVLFRPLSSSFVLFRPLSSSFVLYQFFFSFIPLSLLVSPSYPSFLCCFQPTFTHFLSISISLLTHLTDMFSLYMLFHII